MRSTSDNHPDSHASHDIDAVAAAWLARHDRGLSAAEQDAYLQWLREDPRHGAAINRQKAAWGALDMLAEWKPVHSAQPNPDLLAVPHRRRWIWTAVLATAAAIALGFFAVRPAMFDASAPATARIVRNSEVRTLADGSVVELNKGAEIAVDFSTPERHIRLLRGEAHFTVAKMGPDRPFIVTAGTLRVRAVGTVFNVRMSGDHVDVLVTEGKVRVDPAKPAEVELVVNARMLGAGERTSVNLAEPTPAPPEVVTASDTEIEQVLAWQGVRIKFDETPLQEAVDEFNRHNGTRFIIADRRIASILIGGNIRADNAEAFAHFLQNGFGVSVESDERGRFVLHAAR
ncbi:MAG: hypothetical protein C0518_07940 [Opitutus sp.]|nr:hypothetical protein [Opitutus sp.]